MMNTIRGHFVNKTDSQYTCLGNVAAYLTKYLGYGRKDKAANENGHYVNLYSSTILNSIELLVEYLEEDRE